MRVYLVLFLTSCALAFAAIRSEPQPPVEHDYALEMMMNEQLAP
jgi:hypothetical protein